MSTPRTRFIPPASSSSALSLENRPTLAPSVSFDNLEPRLGTIFSLGLALNSLFTPALRFAYAINHDNFYEVASKSLSPYCMVSLLILNVSRVDQKTEKASRYFITFWILLNYGSALIGTLFDPQNGSILTAIFHTLNIPATLFGRNVMISCRRRINEFDHEQKYSYIFRGVFFSMSTMPTILYFTIETLRCLHKESNQHNINFNEVCGACSVPQYTICCLFLLLLISRLYFAPFSQAANVTIEQFARFEGLPRVMRFQAFCAVVAAMISVALFSLMQDSGPATLAMSLLSVCAVVCIILIAASEGLFILWQKNKVRKRQRTLAAMALIDQGLDLDLDLGRESDGECADGEKGDSLSELKGVTDMKGLKQTSFLKSVSVENLL